MATEIRTLGLYQPYASLMLHGKLESRWVAEGKKPPFPLGKYLLYATTKAYTLKEFRRLSGDFYDSAIRKLTDPIVKNGQTDESLLKSLPTGAIICEADLVELQKITLWQELADAYYEPPVKELDPRYCDANPFFVIDGHVLWGLHFENVKPVVPIPFKGKQGVGIATSEVISNIIHLSPGVFAK